MSEGQTERLLKLVQEARGEEEDPTALRLGSKGIPEIPVEVIELIKNFEVERLGLEHNQLTALPPEICLLRHMRYLDINSNNFKTFPVVLCQMSNLEILDISKNKIRKLPKEFGNLMSLKALKISKNQLRKLPAYIGEMKNLQWLRVDNNQQLTFPPKSICAMPKGDEKIVMPSWLANLKEFLRQTRIDQATDRFGVEFETSDSSDDEGFSYELYEQSKGLKKAQSADSITHLITVPARQIPETSNGLNTIIENEQMLSKHRRPNLTLTDLPRRDRSYSNDSYSPIHQKTLSQDSNTSLNGNDYSADGYFKRLRTVTATDHLQPNDISLREASRNILYALSQVHKAISQYTSFTGNERVFTSDLRNAGKSMEQLVNALERFDNDSSQKRPDGEACSRLLKTCSLNITVFKNLVLLLQSHLRFLPPSPDNIRYSRTLLLMLHGSIAEIKFAWEAISPLLNNDYTPYTASFRTRSMSRSNSNSVPYSAGLLSSSSQTTPYTPSVLSSTSTSAPVVFVTEELMQKIEMSIFWVENVLQLLTETINQVHATLPTDEPLQSTSTIRGKIRELALHVRNSKEGTKRLKKSLANAKTPPSSPKDELKLYDDAVTFLQTTVKMSSFVKEVMQDIPIRQEVRLGLGQVTKSNIELTHFLRQLGAPQDPHPSSTSPLFFERSMSFSIERGSGERNLSHVKERSMSFSVADRHQRNSSREEEERERLKKMGSAPNINPISGYSGGQVTTSNIVTEIIVDGKS